MIVLDDLRARKASASCRQAAPRGLAGEEGPSWASRAALSKRVELWGGMRTVGAAASRGTVPGGLLRARAYGRLIDLAGPTVAGPYSPFDLKTLTSLPT